MKGERFLAKISKKILSKNLLIMTRLRGGREGGRRKRVISEENEKRTSCFSLIPPATFPKLVHFREDSTRYLGEAVFLDPVYFTQLVT